MSSDSESPKTQQISLATAITIVVANMVGTGVFVSLGYQLIGGLNSGFAILVLWAVGGLLSFCGAVCYAELAARNPRSGGEYHLMGEAYHPLAGFLTGWISVTVGFAAPIAIAAAAFGGYFNGVFHEWLGERFPSAVEWIDPTRLAILIVLVVTLIHLAGIRAASRFQVIFTTGKVLIILVLIVCAFAVGTAAGDTRFKPAAADSRQILSPAFAISLYWVMYAYSGWNAAAYVAGEMKKPQRNVPLALLIGTLIVAVLYVGLNWAFLHSTPQADLAGNKEVGLIAAEQIFGDSGGKLMGILICFGLISTVSSMVWTGPRVTQVMGEDYRLFSYLSHKSKNGAPTLAIIVQSTVVIILLALATFDEIMYYVQSLIMLSSLLTVLAVFWMRWKDPGAKIGYRAFGYPLTPIIFAAVSIWMLYWGVREHTKETAWGLLTLVAGLIVFWLARKSNQKAGLR